MKRDKSCYQLVDSMTGKKLSFRNEVKNLKLCVNNDL